MQYAVSTASALAFPRFLDRALPPERPEAIDEPATVLRSARNVNADWDETAADQILNRFATGPVFILLSTVCRRRTAPENASHGSADPEASTARISTILYVLCPK